MSRSAQTLDRAVVWRNLASDGRDYCSLWSACDGCSVQGTVIGIEAGRPLLAHYAVHCDDHWLTRRVEVECRVGNEMKTLRLTVDQKGTWRSSDQELPDLAHCPDVDLAITPATNTLPIRRLRLAIGESQAVTAAWVQFPDLTVEVLPQRYTRLSETRYRYQSDSGFSTELRVDELGLIHSYVGGWERIAAA